MTKYFRILILAALTTLVLSEDRLEMFHRIKCNGTYDAEKFDTVLSVCEDCYKFYTDRPDLHEQCLGGCFRSHIFYYCLYVLLPRHTSRGSIGEILGTLRSS
ncbi:hypothetical protein NPIL_113941 [Nephila pilipes]|uniref:Uncharacterized protein n=1 Tax=Nephila pilipes TaxID=299642 RepID=A0A8X6MRR0_NEPPI|nr:hypothetical protein NPIL_113941 [Nephila pilipes]